MNLKASDRLTDLQNYRLIEWFIVLHFAAKKWAAVRGEKTQSHKLGDVLI